MTKDAPAGCIVDGNPALVIGRYDDLIEKRTNLNVSKK